MNLIELNDNLINEINLCALNLSNIKSILDSGADINFVNPDDGYTPLMVAVAVGNEQAAEYLLWQGADPLISNSLGEIASALCRRDSQIYLKLKDFELLYATVQNDLPRVKLIVEAGALVNFQGHGGYSALMVAVEEGLEELTEYFLELGADMSLKCYDERDVFDLVRNPAVHSSLMKMKVLREQIQALPERMTFRFFMASPNSRFTIN